MKKVLWVTLDSTVLSLWGCYGNLQGWTPHLDGMAAQGVLFDEYYATKGPEEEGETRRRWAECLRGCSGVAAFVSLEDEDAVSRINETAWSDLERGLAGAVRESGCDGPVLIRCALPSLTGEFAEFDEDEETPEDESPPPRNFPYQMLTEAERTGVIQDLVFLDEWLGKIFDTWDEETGGADDAWFIVTAARGLSFPFVTNEEQAGPSELLRHVPLLICNGRGEPAGERIGGLTSEHQLEQGLIGLLGGEQPGDQAWLKFLRGETTRETKSLLWREPPGDQVLRTKDGMLVEGETVHVFHLPEDRWGLQDVSHSEEELAERLHAELQDKLAKDQTET